MNSTWTLNPSWTILASGNDPAFRVSLAVTVKSSQRLCLLAILSSQPIAAEILTSSNATPGTTIISLRH